MTLQLGETTTLRARATVISHEGDRSPLDLGGIDVYRWENEGGAPELVVGGGMLEPAHAAP